MAEWFRDVTLAAPIEVFKLSASFKEDTDPRKVNLGVGAYRTDEGKPWVLPVVKKVEDAKSNQSLDHEYLPVSGRPDYTRAGTELMLGEDSPALKTNRASAIQAVGGTGALRIGFDFLRSRLDMDTIYVSSPTWGNHKGIAKSVGFKNIVDYRYWDDANKCLDIEGFKEDLKNAPKNSVIVLHMCAHNPSGIDPTHEQWDQLAEIIKERQLFPHFDCAYQGFASGDLNKDSWAVRRFVERGFELFAAQSFSKNFGLYNERVGNLIYVVGDSDRMVTMKSQLEIVVRTTWSNSPSHGSYVVASVLNNPAFRKEWEENVRTMANRIRLMRQQLFEKLQALGHTWQHVIQQNGMFSYTGLNKAQCEFLVKDKHIYLLSSGRINMCGLTTGNIDYVAQSIHEAITGNSKI